MKAKEKLNWGHFLSASTFRTFTGKRFLIVPVECNIFAEWTCLLHYSVPLMPLALSLFLALSFFGSQTRADVGEFPKTASSLSPSSVFSVVIDSVI